MTFRKFNHRNPVQTWFTAKSETIQSARDDVDINNIVRRYDSSGFLPSDDGNAQYGDVTSLQNRDLTAHLMSIKSTAESLEAYQADVLANEQKQYDEFLSWQSQQSEQPPQTVDSIDDSTPPAE